MKLKKLSALLLSLILALALAAPSLAAGGAWYDEAEAFAVQHRLLSDANGFNPQGTVTRTEVLEALYALEGKPAVNGGEDCAAWVKATLELPEDFTDGTAIRGEVAELYTAYAASRSTAVSALLRGDENGNLNLDKPITRAELATLLLRLHNAGTPAYSAISDLQVLATSDLHGKFYPWSYALNAADSSGSMAQLKTAVKALRTDNSLLVDAGDTIQDNSAFLFLDEDVHPMIQAVNDIGYDVWVTGNHEYNKGMDVLKKVIGTVEAKPLVGNVLDEDGKPIADGYTIIEKDGVRIGIIGMVTPNIRRFDAANLAKCTVTDPAEESRAIIDRIKDDVDVFIGVMHMGLGNEFDVPNSGVRDLIKVCPEFAVVVSSHDHTQIEGQNIDGVLVVQNKNMAQTMNEIHLIFGKSSDGWDLVKKTSKTHQIKEYAADEGMLEKFKSYHETAVKDAESVIGKLEGGSLAPENEIKEIPAAQIMDTAMIDLINEVQMYYTGAKVSAAALFVMDANLHEGDIHKSDSSLIYKYDNTLYKLEMTGAQLRKYMEWSMNYYNQYHDGDLTISFNPDIRAYNYDMFAGVNYEVDISKPAGERIVNLTWPDGTPVKDDESFIMAVNNYRCNSQLLADGTIFEAGQGPKLLESDVRGDVGGVRELIALYIQEVKGGTITPVCDNNWKIVGNNWDEALHQKAVEQLASGALTIPASEDGRTPNVRAITVSDLK